MSHLILRNITATLVSTLSCQKLVGMIPICFRVLLDSYLSCLLALSRRGSDEGVGASVCGSAMKATRLGPHY